MQVHDIQEKIDQLKNQLIYWERHLKDIQNICKHDFHKELFYKRCLKCQKTEALYY
ncbi:serine protease [Halalkalibacter alkalisediminis]|uniref:Serine protease n=1 Tax=Halalkalibacter alkalisediminis TaxID=935616 RepID=A0ABV6NNP9_9BACI|nr:serine protease [Halalkalibacter alkalisediminis]